MSKITEVVNDIISKVNDTATKDYVDSELALIPSKTPSLTASSVLLSGNVALENSVVTKNFAVVTYTGNGSTQSITTGINSVDFTVSGNGSGYWLDRTVNQVKNDAGTVVASGSCDWGTNKGVSKVHIKSRSVATNNFVFDGLRGILKEINTNTTEVETSLASSVTAFASTGFSVGNATGINVSSATYVAYQTLYTHIKWGTTSHGKFYVEAYNPVTREGMIYYIGSGSAGHQIPHSMGVEIAYFDIFRLAGSNNWVSQYGQKFGGTLNSTTVFTSSDLYATINTDNITFTSYAGQNPNNEKCILYYKCKSENWTIGTYQGTGASGNFIETKDVNGVARKPRRIICKATSTTSNWVCMDTVRNDYYIRLNTSDAEVSYDVVDYNPNGFTFKSSETNVSGVQYLYLVEFDTNSDGGDGYFNYPTDNSNLNITSGKFTFTDGIGDYGYNVSTESFTGSIDFTGISDGIKWVGYDKTNFVFRDTKPTWDYTNNRWVGESVGISFLPKPYQITSETPQAEMSEFDALPEVVGKVCEFEEVRASGNISADTFSGKNACTAWVNFDGTTTPPTIRDSYNVSSVVRVSTGAFCIYFEENMDNTSYSISGSTNDNPGVDYGCTINYTMPDKQIASCVVYFSVNTSISLRNQADISIHIFGGKN